MNEPDLWLLSINAFAAVVVILSLLGGALRVLTAVFPPGAPQEVAPRPNAPSTGSLVAAPDATIRSAIETAVNRAYPGAVVLDVHERSNERAS